MADRMSKIAKGIEKMLRREQSGDGICHICQRQAFLEPFWFGLVKGFSSKRNWGGLAKYALVSSIPLGFFYSVIQ